MTKPGMPWAALPGYRLASIFIAACALSACAGGPRVPDWKINSIGHVERFTEAYLKGDARVQAREFDLARAETARTGRPELVARIELNRCAAQVASLDFEPCTGFEPLRADAANPNWPTPPTWPASRWMPRRPRCCPSSTAALPQRPLRPHYRRPMTRWAA